MINKEPDNKTSVQESSDDSGIKDIVNVAVQAHLIIKDKDTDTVLLNKRG